MHLSVEQLASHLEHRLQGRERDVVVAHLVECAECRRDYVGASRVLERPRSTWRGFGFPLALATAAALVFMILPHSPSSRGMRESRDTVTQRVSQPDVAPAIQITSPADGEDLTAKAATLTWHVDVPNALYRVTVQNAEGSVVWRTNTTDTTVTVPSDVKLVDGSLYYWVVDALHPDGRSARSTANAFRR